MPTRTVDPLAEAILARDQTRTTDLRFRMVRPDGRSVGDTLGEAMAPPPQDYLRRQDDQSACLPAAQTLASATLKRRSLARSPGRGIVRLHTASCWRKAGLSRAS